MTTKRCAIFIDGAYWEKLKKIDFGEPRTNLFKLSEILTNDYERLRTYYYNCAPYQSDPPTREEKEMKMRFDSYINKLKEFPRFEIRFGTLRPRGGDFVQKGVDVLFAIDLVRLSLGKHIDKAILITGDNDFVPAIKVAKDEGVLVFLYHSMNTRSYELFSVVDEKYPITKELIDKIKI